MFSKKSRISVRFNQLSISKFLNIISQSVKLDRVEEKFSHLREEIASSHLPAKGQAGKVQAKTNKMFWLQQHQRLK